MAQQQNPRPGARPRKAPATFGTREPATFGTLIRQEDLDLALGYLNERLTEMHDRLTRFEEIESRVTIIERALEAVIEDLDDVMITAGPTTSWPDDIAVEEEAYEDNVDSMIPSASLRPVEETVEETVEEEAARLRREAVESFERNNEAQISEPTDAPPERKRLPDGRLVSVRH